MLVVVQSFTDCGRGLCVKLVCAGFLCVRRVGSRPPPCATTHVFHLPPPADASVLTEEEGEEEGAAREPHTTHASALHGMLVCWRSVEMVAECVGGGG